MGWRKGPLPPDTWQWGGVVLHKFDTPHGYKAFFFADFCGDHVKLQDGQVVKPDEIAWWNNDITLPENCTGRANVS